MIYELYTWDTANLIYAYDTEAEALASVVRYMLHRHGCGSVATWTLLMSTPDGMRQENVAAGDMLADLALRASAGTASLDVPGTMHTDGA